MIDPQVQKIIAAMANAGIRPIEQLTVAEARQQVEDIARGRSANPSGMVDVEDVIIPAPGQPDIPARLYRPSGERRPLPAVLYYHGGGHVIGSLETHDATARNFASGTGAIIVSVQYRMGPEARFPAAVDDAYASLLWVHANAAALGIDGTRLAVAGDSAGGNLATVVALVTRDRKGPALRSQVLIYPVTDYRLDAPSYQTFASGYGILTSDAMRWFRGHYLGTPDDALDWRASPVLAELSGIAPAIVAAAQCDPLIDDIRRYRDRLQDAKVPTTYIECPGMIHGFFAMGEAVDVAARAQREVFAALTHALSPR